MFVVKYPPLRLVLLGVTLFISACWSVPLYAATYVEVLDNEENTVWGTLVSFDPAQVVLSTQEGIDTDESQAMVVIPLEKLVKIRNLSPHPYLGTGIGGHTGTGAGNNFYPSPAIPLGRNANDRRFSALMEKVQRSNEQFDAKTFPASVITLELKGGFRLIASSFTVVENQACVQILDFPSEIVLPLDSILAVRFAVRGLSDVLAPPVDWLQLATPNSDGDRLIVGMPGAFDVYTGILNGIGEETISFAVDGDVLPVPRRRVYGIVLHEESAPSQAIPSTSHQATLTLWSGTQMQGSGFSLQANASNGSASNESELSWTTSFGTESNVLFTLPLAMVSEIDFGDAGIVSLLDLERVRTEFSLPLVLNNALNAAQNSDSDTVLKQLPMVRSFFENRWEHRADTAQEIMLDGKSYKQGITLYGTSLLEYRLPQPFASFRATAGIDEQFRPHASGQLQILADSQVLGTWEFRGDEPAKQIQINLPQNCRLLTFAVVPLRRANQPNAPHQPNTHTPAIITLAEPKLSGRN